MAWTKKNRENPETKNSCWCTSASKSSCMIAVIRHFIKLLLCAKVLMDEHLSTEIRIHTQYSLEAEIWLKAVYLDVVSQDGGTFPATCGPLSGANDLLRSSVPASSFGSSLGDPTGHGARAASGTPSSLCAAAGSCRSGPRA